MSERNTTAIKSPAVAGWVMDTQGFLPGEIVANSASIHDQDWGGGDREVYVRFKSTHGREVVSHDIKVTTEQADEIWRRITSGAR